MSTTENPTATTGPAEPGGKLPVAALLSLTTAVFITSLTETLPAGVLPAMSADLSVSESATGQTVTIYAVGTALTAIPLTTATARWRRRRLLLAAMGLFLIANTVTAISPLYPLTMTARFLAGVAAGVAWALLAPYARRLAPAHLQGKAIAIAMSGIPVALSLGVPAGTFIGRIAGWQIAFAVISALTLALLAWIVLAVPDHPGQEAGRRPSMSQAARIPGVAPVLFVTLVFVLAHTILYAYIATLLAHLRMGSAADAVLLTFGVASIVSVWLTAVHIHRRLRPLTIASVLLVAVAAAALAAPTANRPLVYVAAALWGLGWGGLPTLLQTAVADAGGDQADAAQAMLVTGWNVAMAAGAAVGGILLDLFGPTSFPWSVIILLAPVLAVTAGAKRHGFPSNPLNKAERGAGR